VVEKRALNLTTGLATSILHPQPDSEWMGRCYFDAGSPTPLPIKLLHTVSHYIPSSFDICKLQSPPASVLQTSEQTIELRRRRHCTMASDDHCWWWRSDDRGWLRRHEPGIAERSENNMAIRPDRQQSHTAMLEWQS